MDVAERLRTVLADRGDVRVAYLFGSAAAGRERRTSDVDVGVLFDAPLAPAVLDLLGERLEAAVGRRVDLVVLNSAPPLLAREVIGRGRLLVCRDHDERAQFEVRTTARYQDTAHLRRIQHGYLRERADAHRAGPS